MPDQITVVVSRSRELDPARREIEEAIVAGLTHAGGFDVVVVPHLYDLAADASGVRCLTGITGEIVVCSWLHPRATHWILDRHSVRGMVGETMLEAGGDSLRDRADVADAADANRPRDAAAVADQRAVPCRKLYCLDLRCCVSAAPYLSEIRRIAAGAKAGSGKVMTVDEQPPRRWYPVIDYSRCTNCLECIDFCLFGVYDIDRAGTILVTQPDACRMGCPACSRVCPEHAIMFPQHRTPAIAGGEATADEPRIDLSALFGAGDAAQVAARERDEYLTTAGRPPAPTPGATSECRDQAGNQADDELDDLIDEVDEVEP